MGYFIAGLVILAICSIIRATWNVLFRPIFSWASETIQRLFMSWGMGRLAARALLSVVVIVVLIVLISFL